MNYDDTNKGAFFKNDRKEKDTHPDYKGSINVDGVDYWLSGWIKVSREDATKKFMSLSVTPKQQEQLTPRKAPSHDAARARQLPPRRNDDSDVPF